ncbi:hypothetical protein HII36_36415 [Nonomuraea sp. NN258]|nr:hypothetical protein [Nonomuraea antri]
MDQVQHLLAGRGVSVVDAILITIRLLGAGPDALGRAKATVLTSAARTTERAHHERFVSDLLDAFENAPPETEPPSEG